MKMNVTCIILAGGPSRRMGHDKTLIQVEGVRLFDYVYDKCSRLFSEIIIVTNKPKQFDMYQAHIVSDKIPGANSLGGLYTGLLWSNNYYTFCVGCDMPFLKPELLVYMLKKRFTYDVVVPLTQKGLEPLHAIYSKRCIDPIGKILEKRGEFRIASFYPAVRVMYCEESEIKRIDPYLASFTNVNTKKDLATIQAMLRGYKWEENLKSC